MGFAAWRLFVACTATKFATADASDGSWRKEYPPWGEIGVPTEGAPVVWLPLIGPFTNHGCFPSRYMSMRIAVSHVNRRDGTFCPAIASLASDFELQYGIKDTGSSGIGAASAVLDFFSNSTVKSMIKVFLGPNGSGASKASSTILSVFGIPQISWASTNADLSNKVQFPQYFRTVSPDSLVMKVLSGLISSLGFTSVNVLYFDAPFQSGQAADFTSSAESEFGMQVTKYSIPNSGEGGVAVSDRNRPMMNKALEAVRVSDCRVVVAFCIYEEAWDLFSAAFDYDLVNGDGWVWFGADGLAGNQLIGDVTRVYAFVGAIYVAASSQGPRFEDYVAKWAEDMPSTLTPEFSEMDLCLDHRRSGSPPAVCDGNPEFKGWVPGDHNETLLCKGYTAQAYDAVVTLAVVADRLLARLGAHPDELTPEDWLSEMRRLSEPNQSFDCLSGELTYNEDQERILPMDFFNWQSGSLEASRVARWSLTSGYAWQIGQEIQWPGGARAVIQDAAHPPSLPSGALPECGADEYYSTAEQQCTPECPAGEEPDEAGACRACAAGTFKPSAGQRACQNCTAGRVAAASGSRLCSECGPGTFQGAEGQEDLRTRPLRARATVADFVLADKVRESTRTTIPALQTMLEDPELRGWIVTRELNFDDAIRGRCRKEYVSVSHRWMTEGAPEPRRAPPDPRGVQFAAIKQYLTKRDEVKYLWLDWPCMWQANKEGQREITVDEKAEFDLMLSEANMLYLGCRVVILLDMTYLSRFWTLYEAWLSQMKPTSTGLKPALISDASRCDVVPIMGANDAFRSALLSTIANQMSSASLAAKYLRNDDILVTNASDKEKQLDRVSGLDYRVIQVEIDAQAEAGSTVQMQRVLAAGGSHSLGLLKDGTVTACGGDANGQRSGVAQWRDVVQIAAGYWHSLGLLKDGTVTACGRDDEGQRSGVAQWRDVVQIAAGGSHSLGLLKDGTVTACGRVFHVGHDSDSDDSDGQSSGVAQWRDGVAQWRDVVQIAAGDSHSLGLLKDGTVTACGDDYDGQRSGVAQWRDVVQIAAGAGHSLGLLKDGTFTGCGFNRYGQASGHVIFDARDLRHARR